MAESKKYYWIKLKTDFFNRDEIDFLLSQKNGCEYIVLYQMLCLMVANTDGQLQNQIGEVIVPYDTNKIVRDTKYFDFDTVTVALELYKKLGLVYVGDNNCLTIANYDELVGSETTGAKRIREWREKQKALQCNNSVTQDVTQENRDKSLEIRDKSIDKEIEKENKKETFVSIVNEYTNNQSLRDAINDYIDMRKKQKGFTTRALKLNLNELDKLAMVDDTKIEIINQSIMNGWKSFYELKFKRNTPDYTHSSNSIQVTEDDIKKYI